MNEMEGIRQVKSHHINKLATQLPWVMNFSVPIFRAIKSASMHENMVFSFRLEKKRQDLWLTLGLLIYRTF